MFSSYHMLHAQSKAKEKKNVVIIGAGIAGLSAAKTLKVNGYNPIILEAQNKVGGRIKTNRSLGFPLDEGTNWIHGPEGNPVTILAEEAGVDTFETDDQNINVYDIDSSTYSKELLQENERIYNEILEEIKGHKDKSSGEAFYEEYPEFKDNRLWTYMLSAFLEFDMGGDIYQLSSRYFYDDEDFDGRDLIITNGYDTLTNYLAKDLDIHLETIVQSVDYSEDKVLITTSKETYTADLVLVTVPLGVLKENKIQFTPVLPPYIQKAIDLLDMGHANKFLLVWEDAFWEKELHYIGYTPEEKGKFNFFLNLQQITKTNALVTFSFGHYALETEKMSDEEVQEAIMQHLRVMYGDNIPQPTHFLSTKWSENPFSHGAYSFVPKAIKSKLYNKFEKSVKKCQFFAGEHTNRDYRGTVHGAYLSGIRAAKDMMRLP